MSNPNLNYSNLDARYTKPADVDTKIATQATADAGQYATKEAAPVFTKQYGVLADGTTDDSAALQTAINFAITSYRPLYVQPGTIRCANIIIPTGLTMNGAGPNRTTFKLLDASTVPVFISTGFAGLTGGATSGGINNFNLSNLSIDGNKLNAPSGGNGISIYGWCYRLQNVMVHDCHGAGIYSEWGNNPASPGNDSMESQWLNVKSHDNDGDGIIYNGPHDSQLSNIVSYHNGASGIWMGPLSSGTQVLNAHSWGATQTYAWKVESTGLQLNNIVGEGGSIARILIGGSHCTITGYFYAGGTTTPTGVLIGDSAHTAISGTVLTARIEDCTGNPLDFTYDGGRSLLHVTIDQSGGNSYTGTPASSSAGYVMVNGVTGVFGYAKFQAGTMLLAGGGDNALIIRNASGTAVLNQNNTTNQLQLANGNSIRLYSDSFTSLTGNWRSSDGKLTMGGPIASVRQGYSLSTNGAVTIDAAKGNVYSVSLSANATSSNITNPSTGQVISISWVQDATGGRIYVWPANCKFAGASAPSDATAGRKTTVQFEYDGTSWNELGRAVAVG